MPDSIEDFNAFRARMNDLILGAGNLTISRFFALDHRAYEPGALGGKTKAPLPSPLLISAGISAGSGALPSR